MLKIFRSSHADRSTMPRQGRHTTRSARSAWLVLGAAAALAACGGEPDPAGQPEEPAAAPAPLTTSADDWRRLGDGSFVRTASGVIADRREADRCWPVAGGFDCLSLDAIAYAPGVIVVAARTRLAAYADVPVASPEVGFSCAIYPSGLIEQRLIRAEASRLQNDDTDGTLWSAADVARLGGAGAGFVDCKALAGRLAGNEIAPLADAGFARAGILP